MNSLCFPLVFLQNEAHGTFPRCPCCPGNHRDAAGDGGTASKAFDDVTEVFENITWALEDAVIPTPLEVFNGAFTDDLCTEAFEIYNWVFAMDSEGDTRTFEDSTTTRDRSFENAEGGAAVENVSATTDNGSTCRSATDGAGAFCRVRGRRVW